MLFRSQLPSFVYVLTDTVEAPAEPDPDADPDAPAPEPVRTVAVDRILQPNDTTADDVTEANAASLDQLYLCAYRITMADVAPDFALTTPHVGVNVDKKVLPSDMTAITVTKDGAPLEESDSDAIRNDDRVIQIVQEYFDNSLDLLPGDDHMSDAAGNATNWRTDGYVIVAKRGDASQHYQYEEIYNSVAYDVPRPMGEQRGGEAGLVKIPRSALTGRVWDDTGVKTDDGAGNAVLNENGQPVYNYATGYNGVQDEGEAGIPGQTLYLTQWFWVPGDEWVRFAHLHPELAATADDNVKRVESGEGDNVTVTWDTTAVVAPDEEVGGYWVHNTAFGSDTFTSNLYSRATGEDVAPIVYDAANGQPLAYQDAANGVLKVITDDEGRYTVTNLPTAYVTDNDDTYYLASYRVELESLYHDHSNAIDDTENQWILTRYHADGADAAKVATVNNAASVVSDSDVASEVDFGIAGGMVVAGRVSGDSTGTASDADAAPGTTRTHDGQVILAQEVTDLTVERTVDEDGNYSDGDRNAWVELPAGQGAGREVETYSWISDPDAVDGTGERTVVSVKPGSTETVVAVEAGDIGQVQQPDRKSVV